MNRAPRSIRIARLAARLAIRAAKRRKHRVILERKGIRARGVSLITYDLETTPIKAGTPSPLYITAFSASPDFFVSSPIKSIPHLLTILQSLFLTPEFAGARFVGWNSNRFDIFFIGAALLSCNDYILRPYLTRNKNLRGLRVSSRLDDSLYWEFLDGMAMTGITQSLASFLKVFAPDHLKLSNSGPDFQHGERFDSLNPHHVLYAERDAVGLWHGMRRVSDILSSTFPGFGLQPTVGNLGIKLFRSHVPKNTRIVEPPFEVTELIRRYVMRGGYCHLSRSFTGPIWKYDINQAYAAAMRDTFLPAGRCIGTPRFHPGARTGIYLVSATYRGPLPVSDVPPFYHRTLTGKSAFSSTSFEAWITASEYTQLLSEGWTIAAAKGFFWDDAFSMRAYVDLLENLRVNAPGGPKSAQGELIKSIGNNSYGKTVEQLDGLELIMARECPSGFVHFQDEDDLFQHVFARINTPGVRDYHQPQIGCHITAHVRMVLRRAILLDPRHWLYADTDAVVFSRPVNLPISPTVYGLWKLESDGVPHQLICKKVYATLSGSERHAKGISVGRPGNFFDHRSGDFSVRMLDASDFARWADGAPPRERQIQRTNFVSVMAGAEMFQEREKVGQK